MEALNIRFGQDSSWIAPADKHIASIRAPLPPVRDLSAAIHDALSNPLEFPPLDQALVPGDQLVLVADPQVPSLVDVLSAVIQWFCKQGTPASNIRVVLAADGRWDAAQLASAIEQQTNIAIQIEQHDLDDNERIAYVAANEASEAIYLNRTLVDADVVIPITCARPKTCLDYFGAFGLFPLLSNRATRGQFYSLPSLENPAKHAELRSWADQAAWWVGVMVGIQIVPAAHDGVYAVLAGQLQPLEQSAQGITSDIWRSIDEDSSDLIVSMLDGPACSQSWLSLARLLFAALRLVTPRGTIVIATELSDAIGKGLGRLRDPHRLPEVISKKLASDDSNDALAAAVILSAISSNHVYLISKLRSDSIESLAMGAITSADQLTRLVAQHASCTIIEAGQHRLFCSSPPGFIPAGG